MNSQRTFSSLNHVKNHFADVYRELNELSKLTEGQEKLYKYKLAALKEIAEIIKNNNDDELKIYKEKFEYIENYGIENYRKLKENNIKDFKGLKLI